MPKKYCKIDMRKRWSLGKTDQWCPVYSAFGGFGIYKRASIKGCRYSGVVTRDLGKVYEKIIQYGKRANHPVVVKYLKARDLLCFQVEIFSLSPNLLKIRGKDTGIFISSEPSSLLWRMNSDAYQYPVVCEHVPFHASMIVNGHGKLFINPRMTFDYTR